MTIEVRYLDAGRWVDSDETHQVLDKHTALPLGDLHHTPADRVDAMIKAAARYQAANPWPPHERYRVLNRAAELVSERAADLAQTLVAEAGFTITDAHGEVDRTAETLQLSAQAATQLTGEMVQLSGVAAVTDRIAFTMRHPVGVVAAITPFNSPLNTVAHKVGPALAAGNAVILKPAGLTPYSANALGQILLDAGAPPQLLGIVHGPGARIGAQLAGHPAVGFITFTGSTEVGREIARLAGIRRTQLELGSIAASIVCADADPDAITQKVLRSAFRKAGQVCTSTQRLYVHSDLLPVVTNTLAAALTDRGWGGDPYQDSTFIGALIDERNAIRVADWVAAAVGDGAEVVHGGRRDGTRVQPTVLRNARAESDVMCREIFGPVVSLIPFDSLEEAIDGANSTPFGLAVGVFTQDLRAAMRAATTLRFGAVHINEGSSARVDAMPFGGVKDSGHGHEGPIYAAREMTEERLVTINHA